jgi:catechol 2,3-dioxygenase-like lactoylglutathione lyase family enzyme
MADPAKRVHDDHMDQRIDIVTLGVHDLAAARTFYVEGLGWEIALEVPGDIVFVQVNHGLLLAFYGAADLAADVKPGASPPPVHVPPPMSLAQVVADEDEVIAVCDRARNAGATILKEPQGADFGGFHCYFADPSGFHWEVSTNPGWQVGPDGKVSIATVDA